MSKIIIERMRNGDREAVMKGLSCQGAIYRMDAIAFASLNNMNDTETVEKLMELKKDDVFLDGYTVGDFAVAALDNLGIEKYKGDNILVKNLIESGFAFLR